jgi:hypothetical protein
VLQGKDPNVPSQSVALVQSVEGTYEGASLGSLTVIFKKDISTPFSSFTFEVPLSNQNVLLTGLSFTSGYDISEQVLPGSKKITVTAGTTFTSDAGGTLWIGPPVGLNENNGSSQEITVFPNPGKEICINSLSPICKVQVMDITGRIVIEQVIKDEKSARMNMTSLAEGPYIVKVQTNKGEVVRKWIKRD